MKMRGSPSFRLSAHLEEHVTSGVNESESLASVSVDFTGGTYLPDKFPGSLGLAAQRPQPKLQRRMSSIGAEMPACRTKGSRGACADPDARALTGSPCPIREIA